jgi:hypothetical protein
MGPKIGLPGVENIKITALSGNPWSLVTLLPSYPGSKDENIKLSKHIFRNPNTQNEVNRF